MAHPAGLEHTDIPHHGAIPYGDEHGITPGPLSHDASGPSPTVEVHVDQVSVVSGHEVHLDGGGHDAHSHKDLLSLAKDTGWLSPTSPPMIVAGAVIAGVARPALKRLAGARTGELEQRLAAGERVVVAVDADELDRAGSRRDRLSDAPRIPGQGVERPLEVVEIDPAGPNGPVVVVDDDGPVGRRSVPLPVFEAAWDGSGRLTFTDGGNSGGTR